MNKPKPAFLVALLLVATILCASAARADDRVPPLAGVNRVVFLGDSITYSGAYVEDIEAWFLTRLPQHRIEFINVGLPSETVSGLSEEGHAGGKFPRPDLHERLDRVLAKTKPDFVIACYGMNDGIYLPFDDARFRKFQDGIEWLHDRCTAAGAKILHVTPPVFDEVRGGHAGYRQALDKYADWLLSQRARGWDVADAHWPMSRYFDERRKADTNFFLAKDGVHADDTGHWLIAREILAHLGAKDVAGLDSPKAMLDSRPNGEALMKRIRERQSLMKDAWLTETKHLRPGMKKGLPLAEAQGKAAEIEKQIQEMINP